MHIKPVLSIKITLEISNPTPGKVRVQTKADCKSTMVQMGSLATGISENNYRIVYA